MPSHPKDFGDSHQVLMSELVRSGIRLGKNYKISEQSQEIDKTRRPRMTKENGALPRLLN